RRCPCAVGGSGGHPATGGGSLSRLRGPPDRYTPARCEPPLDILAWLLSAMDEAFFPNLSASGMALEARLREIVSPLAEQDRLALYEIFTQAHPECSPTTFHVEEGFLAARQNDGTIWFPRPLPLVKYAHLACGYEVWLARKYGLPGFVEVENGDLGVDCGAYVGGFALSAARRATEVHVFEPEPRNFECARRNLSSFASVVLTRCGLYDESKTMTLNISASS